MEDVTIIMSISILCAALFSTSDMESLAKEVATMLSFEHTNVMSLVGVCLDGDMPLLIMPFMLNGSVFEFVKHHRKNLLCINATEPQVHTELYTIINELVSLFYEFVYRSNHRRRVY